jgi:glycine oxidase
MLTIQSNCKIKIINQRFNTNFEMQMSNSRDYIIVGQGIAGTVMAHTLMKKGLSVLIIDDPSLSSASRVAAGLFNPVVFKRLSKSWMIDELLPVMDRFYPAAEQLLNIHFYYKKHIVKLFAEDNEKEFWLRKCDEPVGHYLQRTIQPEFLPGIVNAPLGAAEVQHGGNVNVIAFLDASRDYFAGRKALLEEKFDHRELDIAEEGISYKGISAKKVIFCEGRVATENPWFSWLPFRLTKGEIFTIRLKEGTVLPPDKVINKGVFILPLGKDLYRVGATHEWDDLTDNISEKGKKELFGKLEKVLNVPFEIVLHEAGVRPAVDDRRPMLGLHPQHPALAVFNGMGTKGVMLAPYFAERLADFLEKGIPLDQEVDIGRFKGKK